MVNEMNPHTDRSRLFVLILTLLNTIFVAILSGMQVDANIRAERANRDSHYYAVLASNEVVRFGHQSAYDIGLFGNTIKDAQQSLVMGLSALELEQDGKSEQAAQLQSQAEIAQARYDQGAALSMFYADPRYAPSEPDGFPDMDAYLADQIKAANDFVSEQNTATDEFHRWNTKADAYIAILTVLAIAFFLLGVAQSTARLWLFFALSALAIMLLAAAWTGFILIS